MFAYFCVKRYSIIQRRTAVGPDGVRAVRLDPVRRFWANGKVEQPSLDGKRPVRSHREFDVIRRWVSGVDGFRRPYDRRPVPHVRRRFHDPAHVHFRFAGLAAPVLGPEPYRFPQPARAAGFQPHVDAGRIDHYERCWVHCHGRAQPLLRRVARQVGWRPRHVHGTRSVVYKVHGLLDAHVCALPRPVCEQRTWCCVYNFALVPYPPSPPPPRNNSL